MMEGTPIDRRDPTAFTLIVMHDPFRPQLIRSAVIVGVVRVEGQDETFLQPNGLMLQVAKRAGAREAQSVRIIEVLEIGVDPGGCHGFAPIPAFSTALAGSDS
jgi:hypothetical protein